MVATKWTRRICNRPETGRRASMAGLTASVPLDHIEICASEHLGATAGFRRSASASPVARGVRRPRSEYAAQGSSRPRNPGRPESKSLGTQQTRQPERSPERSASRRSAALAERTATKEGRERNHCQQGKPRKLEDLLALQYAVLLDGQSASRGLARDDGQSPVAVQRTLDLSRKSGERQPITDPVSEEQYK